MVTREKALTPRQREVLTKIHEIQTQDGRPPSLRKLMVALGMKAVGSIQDHVRALEKKGYLTRDEEGVLRLSMYQAQESVPILGWVPAGSPLESIESFEGTLSIPVRRRAKSQDHFALKVVGDSMKDAGILEGDYVIVERVKTIRSGEIVVARIENEVTVKIYEVRGARAYLVPANSKFTEREVYWDQDNFLEGRVISVQRFYS
jgi:repressor LexA